mgnify:CR=1 FL=1
MGSSFPINKAISMKLNLNYITALNSHIKIKNDPNSLLISNYSEIKTISYLDNFPKILYFNKDKVHSILYEEDQVITIDDSMKNDLQANFYLTLLIRAEPEILNYSYSFSYIKTFNNCKKDENHKYYNLINSKINIDLIKSYENGDSGSENLEEDVVSNLEKENREYIKNNLNILKNIGLNLDENEIIDMNVCELYTNIQLLLIKNEKIIDNENLHSIIEQLDFENIDIPFMDDKQLFERIKKVLDINNDYIKKYIINDSEDLKNPEKIYFFYMLLKYFFKSNLYIYHIPLLFQVSNTIINIIKSNQFIFSSTANDEKTDFVIQKLCDLDCYYEKYKLRKNKYINSLKNKKIFTQSQTLSGSNEEINYFSSDKTLIKSRDKNENNKLKEEILKESEIIFDISTQIEKQIVKNINIIYGKGNKTTYDEMLVYNKNPDLSKPELNRNFNLYLDFLAKIRGYIEKKFNSINNFNLPLHIKTESVDSENNNIHASYKIFNNNKENNNYIDEDILRKDLNDLTGFLSMINKINPIEYQTNSSQITAVNSFVNNSNNNSSINSSAKLIFNDINCKLDFPTINENILEGINDDESNCFEIIKYNEKISKHFESVNFFLQLEDGHFFISSGNDKEILLYEINPLEDNKLEVVKKIPNLEEILYNISEKKPENKDNIELIACYTRNIYLIVINKKDEFKYITRKYEIPKIITMFCMNIYSNFILCGIDNGMNVVELFNDLLSSKKMFKLTTHSFDSGIKISDVIVALISNNLLPGGENQIVFFDININKKINKIDNIPQTPKGKGAKLISYEGEQVLFCPCVNNKDNKDNGFILADTNIEKDKEIEYNIQYTGSFITYSVCQIKSHKNNLEKEKNDLSNLLLLSGFDTLKRRGGVKLYQLKNKFDVKFLQDIEIYNENYNDFQMPINNIIQCKETGRIIMTTMDGGVHLFSEPNVSLYE